MNCRWCGAELAPGGTICPNCRQPQNLPSPPRGNDPIDRLVAEAEQATKELADATERITRQAAHEVRRAANDPSDSARRALRRFRTEIESARRDLDKLLKDLE